MNFSEITTLKIGGHIRELVEAKTKEGLVEEIRKAQTGQMPYLVIGGGSNLLVADSGFEGLVIKNSYTAINEAVGSGTDLATLVEWANEKGKAGFEKLVGIPGTIGGAIYGNAGAYGQTIADKILWVQIYDSHEDQLKKYTRAECNLSYRHSRFKETGEIILEAAFDITATADSVQLIKTSQEIMQQRLIRYHPGLACPGSFFKNVEAAKLTQDILDRIPADKIMFGKIPAGWLLEEVGAKGAREDGVEIATWHGNLFINSGGGTAADFVKLAKVYRQKVQEKFGIALEPEVQLIGFEGDVWN
ncbi:UDP-N-acetylmuramate dehydrogenase [Candidatus Microgenomates bacterium]|nr:UDP-N-acetylmuramate dehydrogenase [Candidatus Microgenomates bacterium]